MLLRASGWGAARTRVHVDLSDALHGRPWGSRCLLALQSPLPPWLHPCAGGCGGGAVWRAGLRLPCTVHLYLPGTLGFFFPRCTRTCCCIHASPQDSDRRVLPLSRPSSAFLGARGAARGLQAPVCRAVRARAARRGIRDGLGVAAEGPGRLSVPASIWLVRASSDGRSHPICWWGQALSAAPSRPAVTLAEGRG